MDRAQTVLGGYAEVLTLTQRMLEKAKSEQWDDLAALESARNVHLQESALPERPGSVLNPQQLSLLTAQISDILELEQQLELLVHNRHQELGKLFSSLKTQKRLLDVYGGRKT